MFLINKRYFLSFLSLMLILTAVFISSSAWAGKMYKWVDKQGQVHYSQIPPQKDQVKENSSISRKSDASEISATRKGDYSYCGEMKLPGPLYKPKDILLVLGDRVESWTKLLKQSEHSLTTQLRDLDTKNRQVNKYKYNKYRDNSINYTDTAGERRKQTSRTIKQYRCALAWAEKKKKEFSDIKQELTHDIKGAEANYKAVLDAAHKMCGFEPKDYSSPDYNNKKVEWKKCMRPHDRKIRVSGSNLQKLKSQSNKLD